MQPWTCWAVSDVLAFEGVTRVLGSAAGVFDLTFRLEPGEIVAVVGLNGAGKTTLMRLALGMLHPGEGTVGLGGRPLAELPTHTWAQVGKLIEVPLAYPELTVRKNLQITRLLHRAGPETVHRAIETWQLGPVAERRVRRLSLGTRQRVGLAAALQHDPQLIVLDEPGNALDPAAVIRLREQLLRRARAGAAVLVSSHHLDEVARTADRVLLMNRGRLIGTLDATGPDLERALFEHIRADDERRCVPEEVR